MELLLLKVCGSFIFRQSDKTCGIPWSVWVFFAFLEVRRLNKYCLWEANLVFYRNILVWCDKVKICCEKKNIKMLVVLSPIFVADTKIMFGCNFVAPLRNLSLGQLLVSSNSRKYHWILELLVATYKSQAWRRNCAWFFFIVLILKRIMF